MKSDIPAPALTRLFCMRFTSTRRGVRLARHLAAERLNSWGFPYDSEPTHAAELIVGELCANAVRHGSVAGRDFELRLCVATDAVLIEVSDARHEVYPPAVPREPAPDSESGYGLTLVDALAAEWGARPRVPVGKTVWATLKPYAHTVPRAPAAPTHAVTARCGVREQSEQEIPFLGGRSEPG